MKKILLLLTLTPCLALLANCASVRKTVELFQDPTSRVVTPQTPKLYRQATIDLEQEKFAEAKAEYEQFLSDQPTTAYTQIANFNIARCFLGLGMYSEAIEKLRYVADQTNGRAPELQALAFYQLSFCYEALGDKIKSLASLLDSYQHKKYFSKEVGSAEIPARIAGAYAAVGNFEQAKVYYAQAEEGVRQLKREIRNKNIPDWLPRTLYYMGDVSLRKVSYEDIGSVLRSLSKAQVYLLESAELGHSSWSKKASDELVKTYEATAEVISEPKKTESLIEKREGQQKQWELAQEFYKVLDEMKNYELIDSEVESALSQNIFKSVAETKKKLTGILSQPRIGQDITEDSKERKRRSRGKVIAPDSSLEQEYVKNRKKKKPEPALPDKLKVAPTPSGDPNL